MQTSAEQRKQPRLYGAFPVLLRLTDQTGKHTKIHTLADNISQGGLYLQMPYPLDATSMIFSLIELPSGAKLATYGQVVRAEPTQHNLYGMAIRFRRSRVFSGFSA